MRKETSPVHIEATKVKAERNRRAVKLTEKVYDVISTLIIVAALAGLALTVWLLSGFTYAPSAEREAESTYYAELKGEIMADLEAETVEALGRTIWGEAGAVPTREEMEAVGWCVCNRADAWGMSVIDVITAPQQFHGYLVKGEVPEKYIEIARDVLANWQLEKDGAPAEIVNRVLPAEYLYFEGDGVHNIFRTAYGAGQIWRF